MTRETSIGCRWFAATIRKYWKKWTSSWFVQHERGVASTCVDRAEGHWVLWNIRSSHSDDSSSKASSAGQMFAGRLGYTWEEQQWQSPLLFELDWPSDWKTRIQKHLYSEFSILSTSSRRNDVSRIHVGVWMHVLFFLLEERLGLVDQSPTSRCHYHQANLFGYSTDFP